MKRGLLIPGEPAPDFELADLNGNIVRLSEIHKDNIVIIYFLRGFL